MATKVTRNWEFILYPESAPEGWREQLREIHVPYFISPLHDKDVQFDGTPKKPHWHVILMFSSNKSVTQMQELAEKLNAPSPAMVQSLSGAARYLIHKDDPDKYQYPASQVEEYGGVSWLEICASTTDTRQAMQELFMIIREHDIRDFDVLIDKLIDMPRLDLLWIATEKRTLAVTAYVNGRWKRMRNIEEQEEKARLKRQHEVAYESVHEAHYLAAIGRIIRDTIKSNEGTPPLMWSEMKEHIKGALVDAGYSADALEEYEKKNGINYKLRYESDTGIDVMNGKTYKED